MARSGADHCGQPGRVASGGADGRSGCHRFARAPTPPAPPARTARPPPSATPRCRSARPGRRRRGRRRRCRPAGRARVEPAQGKDRARHRHGGEHDGERIAPGHPQAARSGEGANPEEQHRGEEAQRLRRGDAVGAEGRSEREGRREVDQRPDEACRHERQGAAADLEDRIEGEIHQRQGDEAREQQQRVIHEMAAIGRRHGDRLECRGQSPEAGGARQDQRQHHGAVAGDLLLAGLVAVGLGGQHGDLEQQQVEGGAQRAEDPPADIRGEEK